MRLIIRRVALTIGMLSIFANLGCGGSDHPDEDDEPSLYDDIAAELAGKPRYDDLHAYDEDYQGTLTVDGKAELPLKIKIMSAPYAIGESRRRHNLNLEVAAELDLGEGPFALTGEATHTNWMRNSETLHALKSREFLYLVGQAVFPANYQRGQGIEAVPNVAARQKNFVSLFDSEVDGECGSVRLIAEKKGTSLVGKLRATYFPKSGGQGWSKDLGTWQANLIGPAATTDVDAHTVQGEFFRFAKKYEENISWVEATLIQE